MAVHWASEVRRLGVGVVDLGVINELVVPSYVFSGSQLVDECLVCVLSTKQLIVPVVHLKSK